ncbi:MAG: NAD(P)/FAD-dependent oxidoreductase [Deltaproteobacteria bacterium]|nr:NAD(P)/FAD-dependent oxidoreductase [Deltaproteobacteria bacterium]
MGKCSQYDAIIIGAGHNGLITAAYLGKAGKKVLLLEKRPVIGGSCVTEEVIPGFKISTTSYVCSLLRPEVIHDLELKKFGFKLLLRDPSSLSLFPDGKYFYFWRDPKKTHQEIAKLSEKDARNWAHYHEDLEQIASIVEPMMIKPALDPQTKKIKELFEMAKLGLRVRKEDKALSNLLRMFSMSVADFLDSYFESTELKATLATDGVIGAFAGPYMPGTAYVLFHHVMGEAEGVKGAWGYVEGGMGGITQALYKSATRFKVEALTNASVHKILVKNGEAYGVALQDGREFYAKAIISNADPKKTFLDFVSSHDLPSDFIRGVKNIKFRSASFKINLALDSLPSWKAIPGSELGPQHRGTIHLSPSMEYIERAFDDAKYGRPSRQPVLECTIPTSVDPTIAPLGKHIMGMFVQYFPYDLKEGNVVQEKEKFVKTCLNLLEEYAPGIQNKISGVHALSPQDLEKEYGLTGGNLFHGEMTLDQLLFMRPQPGWSRYRTPLPHLYLCGSGAHPGGGVLGAPGYLAAKTILSLESSRTQRTW